MRIMMVDSDVTPGSGSQAPIISAGLAHALRDSGDDVAIVTTTRGNGLLKTEVVRYDLESLPMISITVTQQSVRGRGREHDDIQIQRRFAQVLDAVDPDVVVFHAMGQFGLDVVAWTQQEGVPTAALMYDPWWLCERQTMLRSTGGACGQSALRLDVCATCVPDVPGLGRHHRRAVNALNACDLILTPNEWWFELTRSAGVEERRIRVTATDPPVVTEAEMADAPGCLRLGYAGGTTDAQGHVALVAALRQIRRSDYELHVIDPSAQRENPGSANRSVWPLSGYVIADPSRRGLDVDPFLYGIDVLVDPGLGPISDNPIARSALSLGKPVVGLSEAWASAWRTDRLFGMPNRSDDAAADLAAMLDDLLDSGQPRRQSAVGTRSLVTFKGQARAIRRELAREVPECLPESTTD